MLKKAIIFDLDGVLAFTDHYHYLAWKKVADEEGIFFDEQINNRLRGVSRRASLDIILERKNRSYSEEEKEALCEKKNEIYRSFLKKMGPLDISDDTLLTLRELKRKGMKLGIGSASKNTQFILAKTCIADYFDAVIDGTMITKSKPDPEVFLMTAKSLGLSPNEGAVVEDAYAGIEAANAGGFLSIGIGDAAEDPQAKIKIKKLSDLLPIVLLDKI